MKLFLVAISAVMAGFFISAQGACAGVVKSSNHPESNFDMHLRIVTHNDTSGTVYPTQSLLSLSQENRLIFFEDGNITSPGNDRDPDQNSFTRISINDGGLQDIYAASLLPRNNIILSREQQGDFVEGSVGTFLDSFSDEPTLRTIYFTSKELTFHYKRRMANLLQDSFDSEAENRIDFDRPWHKNTEDFRPLTEQEKQALKRETHLLFGLISESYKNIFLVLLGMIGALYLSFHYILNKYI